MFWFTNSVETSKLFINNTFPNILCRKAPRIGSLFNIISKYVQISYTTVIDKLWYVFFQCNLRLNIKRYLTCDLFLFEMRTMSILPEELFFLESIDQKAFVYFRSSVAMSSTAILYVSIPFPICRSMRMKGSCMLFWTQENS